MSFKPRKFDSGKVQRLPLAATTAAVKHSRLKFSSGYLIVGASGDNEAEYISLETVTGGAVNGDTYCDVLPIDDVTEFVATTSTTPVQATHVGNDYDMTDANVVDLAATTDKIFHIDSILDAANTLVVGRFNKPAIA